MFTCFLASAFIVPINSIMWDLLYSSVRFRRTLSRVDFQQILKEKYLFSSVKTEKSKLDALFLFRRKIN